MTVGDITGKKDPPKNSALAAFGKFIGAILGAVSCGLTILLVFPDTPRWAIGMFSTIVFGIIDTQYKIEKIQKKLDCE